MNCKTCREYLDSYLEGSLSDLEMEAMREHLDSCQFCRRQAEVHRELLEALSHLDDGVHAPENLLEGAMDCIHRERKAKRRKAWIVAAGGLAAALCVTLSLGALVGAAGSRNGSSANTPSAVAGGAPSVRDEAAFMMDGGYDAATAEMETPAEAPEPMPAEYGNASMETAAQDVDGEATASSKSSDQEYGMKIIREAQVSMQSEQYDADMEALRALIEECGGFITSNEESGNHNYGSGTRYAALTVRVPSTQLDSFMEWSREIGIVTYSSITETDVTAQYVDTDRKLQAYQKQYDRVLAMMDQAQTVEELIQIESELSRLELCIEESQGMLNYWDSRVNYSTVYISVDEVRRVVSADPTLGERMQNALYNSWDDFVEGCKNLLVNLYGSIPYLVVWIVILGAAGGVAAVVVHRVRRKKTGKK